MMSKEFKKFNDLNELIEELGLTRGSDKSCALNQFMKSIDFVKQTKEFKMADIQRYLKCGYGTARKVVDALCALCVIEIVDEPLFKYKRIAT
jgi:hypothetical protein